MARRSKQGRQPAAERRVLWTLLAAGLLAFAALRSGLPEYGGPLPATVAAAHPQPAGRVATLLESDRCGVATVATAGDRREVAGDAVDPPSPTGKPRAAATEHGCYQEFRAAAQARAGALEPRIREILDGSGPNCRRVALLRALYDTGSAATAGAFLHAIRTLADRSSADGESTPSFAISFLGERAAREPRALALLEQVVFGAEVPLAPDLRRRAAAYWAAGAGEAELALLPAQMWRERDPMLVASVTAALSSNAHTAAAARVSMLLGIAPAATTVVDVDR